MPLTRSAPRRDFLLGHRLERVTAQLRAARFHRASLIIWSTTTLLAAALVFAQRHLPSLSPYAAPLLVLIFCSAAALAAWIGWRDSTDISTAARYLGRHFPELDSPLQAAVEQQPDDSGDFHFLQRRVIDDALRHGETHDWISPLRRSARWLLLAHLLSLIAALAVSAIVIREHRPAAARSTVSHGELEISPGDTEVERGSTVVVSARFNSGLPRDVLLVWQPMGANATRSPMARSLSDPVVAFTLSSVTADIAYHIEYDGQKTRTFALRVFDRPALTRADATLRYPDYTGLPERHIVDTRRISAVIGTQLEYTFILNKPVARAVLRAADKSEIALTPVSSARTQFVLKSEITTSVRYTLHLEDDAGRTNSAPTDIRIEAVENRRPELKLIFPRGDQQVSPLEEMHLQAEARDDFGLLDYGFGLGIAEAEPHYLSSATVGAAPKNQASFEHLLALEDSHLKPDQLVTWFAWADDIGPDGKPRRTTSDVYFAQVRQLDEIFREDANGSPPAGSPGSGQGDELLETQRQISIGIWKLRQLDPSSPKFSEDLKTLRESQAEAQKQLAELRGNIDSTAARAAADQASSFMKQTLNELEKASGQKSTAPLDPAWTAARGAYQSLLRLQPRDTRVTRSQNRGQGSGNRSRDQLNELEFRDENDRYQTETEAQPPPTAEEREQIGVLARLRELSRRQEDLNRRLQELQTALAAAENEARREEIRRELKRLEDEQRRMLSELDEARQRTDRLQAGEQTQQVQQQIDRTREDMRRASEQLSQGEVSQALAAGTRARDTLQQTSEQLRQGAAGRFEEQMREARRQARELTEQQKQVAQKLDELGRGAQSLDDADKREQLAQALQDQNQRRESLLQNLRQVTDDSENAEPQLHRQLYDLLRQQGQSNADKELGASAELLRRGFVDPARERQAGVQREFENLQRAVERAANSVLGNETRELRFAQRELDELTKELQRDRANSLSDQGQQAPGERASPETRDGQSAPGQEPNAKSPDSNRSSSATAETPSPGSRDPSSAANSDTPSGQSNPQSASGNPESGSPKSSVPSSTSPTEPGPSSGRPTNPQSATRTAQSSGSQAQGQSPGGEEGVGGSANPPSAIPNAQSGGPLTGAGFAPWADRLRTVEELVDDPVPRQQLANARARAEDFRRDNQRKGQAPRWDLVEAGVVKPLQEARAWLRQELNRRQEPDALHPIDRDPVPERYAESVRKYYEALGSDNGGESGGARPPGAPPAP